MTSCWLQPYPTREGLILKEILNYSGNAEIKMASSMVKFCTLGLRAATLSRCTVLAPRCAALGRHDPTLKRKKKSKIDPKKLKRSSNISKKPVEILPPIDPEAFVDRALLEPERLRQLPKISEKEKERRVLLLKEWSKCRNRQQRDELRRLQDIIESRDFALRELKRISPWHYEEAIKVDEGLFPLQLHGPTETPPVAGYVAPDAID